jgi:hypothetical protein
VPKGQKRARFEVVESTTEKRLAFDPTEFSKGGNRRARFEEPWQTSITLSESVGPVGWVISSLRWLLA